jgi:hypothetical protein
MLVARWVRFVRNRWQEKSLLCAWPITYESRENFFKDVAAIILVQGTVHLQIVICDLV